MESPTATGPETQRLKDKARKERKSSSKKHFMKSRLSRKLAAASDNRSTADLRIKGLLNHPKDNLQLQNEAQASYVEMTNSPTSEASSGLNIGSLALSKDCQENNARVQRFEAGFYRL